MRKEDSKIAFELCYTKVHRETDTLVLLGLLLFQSG